MQYVSTKYNVTVTLLWSSHTYYTVHVRCATIIAIGERLVGCSSLVQVYSEIEGKVNSATTWVVFMLTLYLSNASRNSRTGKVHTHTSCMHH